MIRSQRLSTKFLAFGIGLLTLALVSIGSTLWITRQLEGGAAAVNEAGRLRMQAWRLTAAAEGGRTDAERKALVGEFEATMSLLRQGDPSRPLAVPWDDETRSRFEALNSAWLELQPLWQPGGAPAMPDATARVDAFVAGVDGLVRAIENTLARRTAVLNLFQMLMMFLAVTAAALMTYMGYLFVLQPLARIQSGLQQVGKGDFRARLPSEAADEFGELVAGFNHMASTLQGLYEGLERKVRDKTRDLEAERTRLAALYEVSSFFVQASALEPLAQGFAERLRRISGADAVAVRWMDGSTERYLLLSGDGLAEDIGDQERCLDIGDCACGQATADAHTRVIRITSADAPRLGHCSRAGYQSLVSVPVRLQQRVLGEVDLFYCREATLSTADRDLYDALCGHFASAVETLRTGALLREAAVSHERVMLARELHDSIAQSLSFLKIQVSLLRKALRTGDDAQVQRTLGEIDAGVKESTADVRELLLHFRTRTDNEDIEQALQTTLRKFEQQTGLKTRLALHGHAVGLPSDVQLQVLHVVQEALSNVRKHASASEVLVDVYRDPQWVFCVRDDGRGFDASGDPADETHVGLQIMRERAERIGARVEVESEPGRGTEVRLALPA